MPTPASNPIQQGCILRERIAAIFFFSLMCAWVEEEPATPSGSVTQEGMSALGKNPLRPAACWLFARGSVTFRNGTGVGALLLLLMKPLWKTVSLEGLYQPMGACIMVVVCRGGRRPLVDGDKEGFDVYCGLGFPGSPVITREAWQRQIQRLT
jgi:hypothetical protein